MNDVFYLPALMHIQPYSLSANIGTVVEKKSLVDSTVKNNKLPEFFYPLKVRLGLGDLAQSSCSTFDLP